MSRNRLAFYPYVIVRVACSLSSRIIRADATASTADLGLGLAQRSPAALLMCDPARIHDRRLKARNSRAAIARELLLFNSQSISLLAVQEPARRPRGDLYSAA